MFNIHLISIWKWSEFLYIEVKDKTHLFFLLSTKEYFLLLQVGVWQRNRKTQRLWLLWIPGCWNRSECHEESKQLRLQWPPPESRRGCRRTEQGWDERVAASTGGPNYGGTCRDILIYTGLVKWIKILLIYTDECVMVMSDSDGLDYWWHIAHLVEHLTRDSSSPGV